MLDAKARGGVGRVVAPLIRFLIRLHVTPTMVTLAGLAATITGAVFFGFGWFITGAFVGGIGSLFDVIDGPLARATGTAGARGALVDTVADRVGESALLTGVAAYLASEGNVLGVALAASALGVSMLVPFIRAKAEVHELPVGGGGIMGRAERMLLLFVGVGLEGFDLPTIMPTLWILTILTGVTAAIRAVRTWRALEE